MTSGPAMLVRLGVLAMLVRRQLVGGLAVVTSMSAVTVAAVVAVSGHLDPPRP
jgi:hypothetical protein